MKKFFFFLLAAAAVCGIGLYFAIPPLVESGIRDNLENLPTSLNRPGEITYAAPEAANVKFYFPQRRLILEKVAMRGVIHHSTLGRMNVLYRFEELEAALSWRMLFLLSPLRGIVSSPYDFETVFNRLSGKNISFSLAANGLQAESVIGHLECSDIMFEGNFLGSLLDQLPFDCLDFLYGTGIGELKLKNFTGNIKIPAMPELVTCKLATANLVEWKGQKTKSIMLENLALDAPGESLFRLAKFNLAGITLPPMAMMAALQTELFSKNPFGIAENLREILNGVPIVAKTTLHGFETPYISLKLAQMDWFSSQPFACNISVEDMLVPARDVARETGILLKDMNNIKLDGSIAVEENQARQLIHKGSVHAAGLADLAWGFNASSMPLNLVSFLSTKISDLVVEYADSSLIARIAAGIAPNAQAAMFVMKIAAGKLCSSPTPENEKLRGAIESFIERPGRISIRGRKAFMPAQFGAEAYMGNLGSILEAVVTPGKSSLDEEFQLLEK